jgi:hypothetical protein
MNWTEVELIAIPEDEAKPAPEPLLAGLAAAPSDLHSAFLASVDHLAEVRMAHESVLSTASSEPKAHLAVVQSLRFLETTVADLGGHREGDALVLPLAGAIQDRVRLDIAQTGDVTTLRLAAESDHGDTLTRTFTLPAGSQLGRAGWRGNDLVFDLVSE